MSHITITDIRMAGHCARGVKSWFNAQGLDFRKFLREGISEEEFLATGDGQAIDVVEHKRMRERSNG